MHQVQLATRQQQYKNNSKQKINSKELWTKLTTDQHQQPRLDRSRQRTSSRHCKATQGVWPKQI